MNCGLRMDHDLHSTGRQIEQAASLDYLKSFVHQCCRINGDPLPHLPSGMFQCLFYRDRSKLGLWRAQERTARRSQPDALNFLDSSAAQALMDCIVFGINGQDWLTPLPCLRGDQFSGRNHAFLIGQSDRLPRPDGFVSGFQAGYTDDGANHKISFRAGRYPYRSLCSVNDLDFLETRNFEPGTKNLRVGLGCNGNDAWLPPPCLL